MRLQLNVDFKKMIDRMKDDLRAGSEVGIRKAMLAAIDRVREGFDMSGGKPNPPPGPLKNRTGRLRNSIKSKVTRNIGSIYTDVHYGKYHETVGCGKAKGLRPFLKPALEKENLVKAIDIIRESVLRDMNRGA